MYVCNKRAILTYIYVYNEREISQNNLANTTMSFYIL